MQYQIEALPNAFLERTRREGVDDLGQAVHRLVARGGEPCRDVLRRARPGEHILLASFSPFTQPGPFREFGPIYLLAEESAEVVRRDVLPLPAGQADDYFGELLVLRAYGADGAIADAAVVESKNAEAVLAGFLARNGVAHVDARFAAYGCFACRVRAVETVKHAS